MRLGRNEVLEIITVTANSSTGETILFDYDTTEGVGDDESWLNYGDSGGPSLAIIGGQPALTGIHWALYSTSDQGFEHYDHNGSIDTLVGTYVDQIRTQVENGGESITVVPESGAAALVVLACLTLGLAGRPSRTG